MATTVNGVNQVTAIGATSVSHDGRGNVSAIGSDSYAYTVENFLSQAPSAQIVPDALMRPAQVTNTSTSTATRFDYVGGQLVGEYDSSNAVQRRFVPGPELDEPLVWYEGSGTSTRRWFHADERGSVVAVSDSSANLHGSTPNRYDEYGVPQGTLTGRFGYTGQAWIPEAGLYHYRARAYHPGMGRFMQSDPIGYAGGMNLYAYVGNNPVNFTDPFGLQSADACPPGEHCEDVTGRPPNQDEPQRDYSDYPPLSAVPFVSIPGWEIDQQEVVVIAAAMTPGMGHNRPPTFWDGLREGFRRSPLGAMLCVLVACRSSADQQVLDMSDRIGNMMSRSVDQTRRGARHKDYATRGNASDDFRQLAGACGCQITINPNGSQTFHFNGRTFTLYTASSTAGPSISMVQDGTLVAKFRY